MGKTFSTGLLTDGISQDSSNNIGIGVAPSGTNKFEVSGSTKLNGNALMSGSLTISSSANAIILPAGQTIGLGTAQIYTGTGGNSGNIFIQGAQTKLYADKVVLEAATAAGVEVIGGTKLSGSFIVSGSATTIGTTTLSGSLTVSGSATTIGATTLSGSLNVSGSITSTSTITAQTLVVQTITSSVLYSSGSNVFGNSLSNTQVMTGSVGITGSLAVNGITNIGARSGGSIRNLNIYGATNANAIIKIDGADGNGYGAQIDFISKQTGGTSNTWTLGTGINGGTNAFELYNGSTTPLSINLSGSVGIGTTSPSSQLEVKAPDTGTTTNYASKNIIANSPLVGGYTGAPIVSMLAMKDGSIHAADIGYLYDTTGYGLAFSVNNDTVGDPAEAMRINRSGNVGIGTTSPTTKLTIDNSANANTNHIDLIGNSSAGAKGHLGNFGGGTYLTSNYYYASGQNNDTGSLGQGAVIIGTSATAGASSISFALSDPGATSPSTKVNILSNGNVGIGTTSPRGLLQLYGAEVAAYKTYTGQGNTGGGDTIINAYRLDGSSAYLRVTDIVALGDDTNNRGSSIRLMTTNTSGVTSAAITINASGSVGMGTTSPLKILHIAQGGNNNGILWTDDAAGNYRNEINNSYNGSTAASNLMTFKVSNATTTGQTTVMTLNGGGYVGIGTTSPDWLFKIEKNTAATGGGLYPAMVINNPNAAGYSALYFFNNTTNCGGLEYSNASTNLLLNSLGALIFQTNSSNEKMRITSGGNVGIGTTSPAKPLSVKTSGGIGVYSDNTYSPTISLDFNSGTNIGHLLADQNAYYIRTLSSYPIYVQANQNNGVYLSVGSTSWTANSDERLKNINSNIESAIDKLLTLRAVNFSWRSDDTNKENLGLIAQDVEQVFPQIIDKIKMPSKVGEEQTDETEYLGVRYTELIPVLVKAIQELKAEINELKNK